MSDLIVSQTDEEIILKDGTRIAINTSMDNSPIGFIVTEKELILCEHDYSESIYCKKCGELMF